MLPPIKEYVQAAYVSSPLRYENRYREFQENVKKSGILGQLDFKRWTWPGPGEVFLPKCPVFYRPHYWYSTLAHKAILNDAWVNNYQCVFIAEDDLIPLPGCDDLIQEAWNELPDDWLGLQLGSLLNSTQTIPGKNLRRAVGCEAIVGYFWNRAGIEAFLQHCYVMQHTVIDWISADLQRQTNRIYATSRWAVGQQGVQYGEAN